MRQDYILKFLYTILLGFSLNAAAAVTITWDRVTHDIDNNEEPGLVYYYLFCRESVSEPISWDNWAASTLDTFIVYSDPRQSNPEIDLYYHVVAVDEWGNTSEPIAQEDQTLPVHLASFEITEKDGRVELTWITTSEVDITGYNILRSDTPNGLYTKINAELIAGTGHATTYTTYTYTDTSIVTLRHYFYKLQVVELAGHTEQIGPYDLFVTTGVPQTFAITQNYPNPFNPSTSISYSVAEAAPVQISVYNINGEKVTTLVDAVKPVGTHTISWNGRDSNHTKVASGTYFYQFVTPKHTAVKAMTLLK